MVQGFYKETDGNSIDVALLYTVTGEEPILVEGIAGFPYDSGESGDTRAMRSDGAVYRVNVGGSFSPSIGDVVYVTLASVPEHEIPVAAYTVTADGVNTVPFLRVIAEKDANDWIEGKLINFNS